MWFMGILSKKRVTPYDIRSKIAWQIHIVRTEWYTNTIIECQVIDSSECSVNNFGWYLHGHYVCLQCRMNRFVKCYIIMSICLLHCLSVSASTKFDFWSQKSRAFSFLTDLKKYEEVLSLICLCMYVCIYVYLSAIIS